MAGSGIQLTEYATESYIKDFKQEMRDLEYFDGHDNVNKKLLTPGGAGKVYRDDFTMRLVTKYLFEFAYNRDEPKDIYYRRSKGDFSYKRLPVTKKELSNVVVAIYKKFFGISPHTETSACLENIMDNITKIADLDNGIWHIKNGYFWDSENTSIISRDGLNGKESYREIGCTGDNKDVDLDLIKSTFDRWTGIFKTYDEQGKDFGKFYTDLPRDLDFMKVWAKEDSNGGIDRYWDMCISVSTIFMHIQPPKAYMLKGKTRNGKSTFIKHLHFLVGRDQTSDIDMPGLADWSFNNSLYGSLLNAPDEDPAEKLNYKATAAFKTLAAKELYHVPVKNSPRPKEIKPHFMMFIPKNDLPTFSGDPTPCLNRLRFIFFLNDLSKLDNRPKDFIKETFIDNPKLLSEYVGFILSLSKYFSEHEMWYSPTMATSSDYVAETVNSTRLYYSIWAKYYAGFENYDLLWMDYIHFCRERGYEPESKEILRQAFFQEGANRQKIYYSGTKTNIWCYLTNDTYSASSYKMGYRILARGESQPGYGTAETAVLKGEVSFVDIRDKIAMREIEEFEGK